MKIYKGLLSLNTLRACFNEAITSDAQYVGILMEVDGRRQVVTIQNHDFDFYENYSVEKYSDKGLTDTRGAKILALAYSDSFRELSRLWNI